MKTDGFAPFDLVDLSIFCLEPDAQGRPVYTAFNAHARERFGRDMDPMLGKTSEELFPGHFGLVSYSNQMAALRDGRKRTYETVLPMPDGVYRSRTTLMPEKGPDGAVTRIIGTSREFEARAATAELQADAEFIGAEIEDFVSLAAHDLRAPIRNVAQIVEFLLEDFVDQGDGKLELVEMLGDVAKMATNLISDVLAHAEASGVTEDVVEFRFDALVEQVTDMLDPMQRLECTATPGTIVGDRAALQIVLRNLVDNALKHAWPEGTKGARRLNLSLKSEPGHFVVTLADNGRGFSDEALRMMQGGKLRPGSGFGLYGVRRLISRRGGMFSAENRASGGRVTISLPGTALIDEFRVMHA